MTEHAWEPSAQSLQEEAGRQTPYSFAGLSSTCSSSTVTRLVHLVLPWVRNAWAAGSRASRTRASSCRRAENCHGDPGDVHFAKNPALLRLRPILSRTSSPGLQQLRRNLGASAKPRSSSGLLKSKDVTSTKVQGSRHHLRDSWQQGPGCTLLHLTHAHCTHAEQMRAVWRIFEQACVADGYSMPAGCIKVALENDSVKYAPGIEQNGPPTRSRGADSRGSARAGGDGAPPGGARAEARAASPKAGAGARRGLSRLSMSISGRDGRSAQDQSHPAPTGPSRCCGMPAQLVSCGSGRADAGAARLEARDRPEPRLKPCSWE